MAESNIIGANGAEHINGSSGTNGVNGHSDSSLPSVEQFLKQPYDFIVVGGGTAGLAIAARLTENPDVTVGVIEAGKNRLGDPLVDTPAMFLQMLGNPEYDWMMFTTPQVGSSHQFESLAITQIRMATRARFIISLGENCLVDRAASII